MATVFPFRAYRYTSKAKPEKAITQPYDKISPELQNEYYKRSPNNVVRILLGRELKGDNELQNKYTRANSYFWHWAETGILQRDNKPAFYAYQQEFKVEGKKRVRKGFIGLSEVEPFGGTVKAHEKTLDAPKADRLNLMKATHTTQGQIFMLYSDPKLTVSNALNKAIEGKKPNMQLKDDDGNIHRLWAVENTTTIKKIQKAMGDKQLFIADGHHRYETGVNYYNAMKALGVEKIGNENIQNLMMTFINVDEPGLTVLPTHRLIYNLRKFNSGKFMKELEKYFHIETFSHSSGEQAAKKKLYAAMDEKAEVNHVFGLWIKSEKKYHLLTLKDESVMNKVVKGKHSNAYKKLDVTILHSLILDKFLGIGDAALKAQTNVHYKRHRDAALEAAKKGDYEMVFLMNPTLVSEVKEIAENNERMPQKSTDFYPKLLSGLTINRYNVGND